jgi:anthranilate/para-aminobenzoate synthase component I
LQTRVLKDELHLPDIQLLLTEEIAVIDNLAGKLYLIVYVDPNTPDAFHRAQARLNELRSYLNHLSAILFRPVVLKRLPFVTIRKGLFERLLLVPKNTS